MRLWQSEKPVTTEPVTDPASLRLCRRDLAQIHEIEPLSALIAAVAPFGLAGLAFALAFAAVSSVFAHLRGLPGLPPELGDFFSFCLFSGEGIANAS